MVVLKSQWEIARLKESNQLVAMILGTIKKKVAPGVSTLELNRLAEELCRRHGAEPAFLGYSGYPYALCVSINEQVVHGFPSERRLKEGDIVSLDFGVKLNGYYGDAALTVCVGEVSQEARRLVRVTRECLERAIQLARPKKRIGDISHAIQDHAEKNGFSVVRKFVGHGIGRAMHEEPQIPNFGSPGQGIEIKPGLVMAIEPMVNAGTYQVRILDDGWTAVTADGKPSAHFEHTVAVTENGPEVLSSFEGLED
jgi:methionyl aminopeptidase